MENFDKEQWRDIDGYDGMYQVSDLGRVRSKKYGDWRVLRHGKNNNGYLQVGLWKDGKEKHSLVHRLVAQAFIGNDNSGKNEINHIDECKQNNRVSNLEYCDRSYNLAYNGLQKRRTANNPNNKRRKLKDLYDPDLSIAENIEVFRANGVECSRNTVWLLRKDLGITRKYTKRP